jgi:hypothetical protein
MIKLCMGIKEYIQKFCRGSLADKQFKNLANKLNATQTAPTSRRFGRLTID